MGRGDELDELAISIATDDAAVSRRVKALAATRPIHDLDRNKASWEGDWWEHYDLLSLGIATIDEVALAMGVTEGRTYAEALAHCATQASRQRPVAATEEHEAVAAKVLAQLITDDIEVVTYVDHTGDSVTRRRHEFRLLYQQWNADDTVHLRASEEAVNVLIDALDTDVESAQIAAEAQMRVLIERGALDSAVTVATRARYLTVQYLERIRSLLRDTQMNLAAHDWSYEVPRYLAQALDHVTDRIASEHVLLGNVADRRDADLEGVSRQRANDLLVLLRSCISRHQDLQRHLLRARGVHRDAQDEDFRRGRSNLRRVSLESEFLARVLAAPTGVVQGWAGDLFERFAALDQPYHPSFAVLVDELLEPPRAPEEGGLDEEPWFDESSDTFPWQAYWDHADEVLDGVREPVTLHQLLARRADVGDDDLDEHLAAAALCHVAHELLATPLAGVEAADVTLLAVPAGALATDEHVDGQDILIVPITVVVPEAAGSWPTVRDDFGLDLEGTSR